MPLLYENCISMNIVKITADTLTTDQLWQMYQLELNCGLEPYTPEMLMECVSAMDTFACVLDDKIWGFITAARSNRYFDNSIYIANLNVGRAYRGRGLAKRLLLCICRLYISQDPVPVTLDVANNNPARRLYQKLGFRETNIPSWNGATDRVFVVSRDCLERNIMEQLKLQGKDTS